MRELFSPGELLSGGGLMRFGRVAAGAALMSANYAERATHLGLRVGARAIGSAAGRAERVVPGAALARRVAETVDRKAEAAAGAAAGRAERSAEWMSDGGGPKHEEAVRGETWSGLAADTALAPLASLVDSSVAIGVESLRGLAATRAGQVALDAGLERLGSEAEVGAFRFETREQRQSFVAVTTDSGATAIRSTWALAEATARLAFNDTGPMRRAIEDGLQEMRHLVAGAEMQDLLPTPMVSESLQERAQLIVDRAPLRFVEALAEDPGDSTPRIGAIARATLEDAQNLRVFVTVYPQVLTLIGSDVGKLLFAGSITFTEMEAFFEGRRIHDSEVEDL
ncbi:MAG: hypothetical protein AAF657_07240 [Acidobacteriota bacterium]